jgi:hypothetical protein
VGPGLANSNNMHIDEFGREIPHQTSSNNKFK